MRPTKEQDTKVYRREDGTDQNSSAQTVSVCMLCTQEDNYNIYNYFPNSNKRSVVIVTLKKKDECYPKV